MEAAAPPEVASNVERGLLAAATDPVASKPESEEAATPQPESRGEALEMVFERTVTFRAHTDSEEELFRLQDEQKEVRRLFEEAEEKRLGATGELDRMKDRLAALQQELAEKERSVAVANEMSVRLQTQLASIDEKIEASSSRSADEVVDRAFDLVRQEFDNSGLPQDAIIAALRKRLPPNYQF
jgi:chromosome segregation ATPase